MIAALVLSTLIAAPGGSSSVFAHDECDIRFLVPAGWKAQRIPPPFMETKCSFGLRPTSRRRQRDRYAIYVSVYRATLQSAENYGLFKTPEGWTVEGRAGERNFIRQVKHPAGRALAGDVEVGDYGDEGEGYQGMASTEIAFLQLDGQRLVVLVAGRDYQAQASRWFLRVFNSINAIGDTNAKKPRSE